MKEEDVVFMGKITAGITHEMNNVLAIIRESAGLIEDIMAINKEGNLPHKEKFGQALVRIEGQVARGVELNKELNRFAHSMDKAEAEMEVGELLVHIQALNSRFARLKQVSLNVSDPSAAVQIRTNPFRLLQLFYACVEFLLERTEIGGEVVLSHESTDSGPAVSILGAPFLLPEGQSGRPADNLTEAARSLDPMSQELGVRLVVIEKDEKVGLQLVF